MTIIPRAVRLANRQLLRPTFLRTYASPSSDLSPNKTYIDVTHPDECPQATSDLISSHSDYLLNTYARPPILFAKGKGLTLTDTSGRDYLDFTAGIAVTALGHNDAEYNAVLAEQAGKLSHASNVYWNEHAGELAKALVEGTKQHGGLGMKHSGEGGKVFFANSGTEANEGALKFARKYGKEVAGKPGKETIVCFTNAFHGRSMGALSVTPNPKYQEPFAPLIPKVRVGEYNEKNQEKVNALIDETTCGVIVEPIQGEGGVGTGDVEWLEMVAKRCKEVGAVLIFDEIQCGLFRTGTMWAHSSFPASAQPDIVTMAKPLANGFPIGAIMVRNHVAEVISVGSHGTTFGGQPLAARLGVHVLSRLNNPEFLAKLTSTSAHLDKLLHRLPGLFPSMIKPELRGRGLIRGIPFINETAPAELVKLARHRGVLLLTAGKDSVRLVPALTVSEAECDKALAVIESCLSIMAEQGTWGKTA